MNASVAAMVPNAISAVDWGAVIALFLGGAAGAGARIAISGTQNFWRHVPLFPYFVPEKRTVGELLAAGVSALFLDRVGVAAYVPFIGPALYDKADIVGKACIFFGYSYVAGHVFRSIEFRRNGNGNGNGNGSGNGDDKK